MRIGLIARMDNSGLGNLTWELYNHIHPDKTMVINLTGTRPNMLSYPERYPGAQFVIGAPSFAEVDDFLDGLDIVFSAETPYSFNLLNKAHLLSIKTIIQPMYEFSGWLQDNITPPDVLGIPSSWHYSAFPDPKILLPVPIATERFKPRDTTYAKHFLHIVGNPAANDRNGTEDLINAIPFIKSNIILTLCSQNAGHVQQMLLGRTLPNNVSVSVNSMQPENYWEMYDGDVLVMPRRYGGLCMPVNEALGAGMPVIMPDISPNKDWLDKNWLTPAEFKFTTLFKRGNLSIDVYKTDPEVLAAKIDQFASDPKFYQAQAREARALAKKFSWDELAPLYNETFNNILKS